MSQTSDKSLPWSARQLMLAAALVCAAVAAMGSSWGDWYDVCSNDQEYSQVFLVIPFAAAIFYVNRRQLCEVKGGTSWLGPAIVGGGWWMAWYGYNYAHQSMWHMGAVLVALGAGLTVLGRGGAGAVLAGVFDVGVYGAAVESDAVADRRAIADRFGDDRGERAERFRRAGGAAGECVDGQWAAGADRRGVQRTSDGVHADFGELGLFAFVTPLKNWVRWLVILLSPITALLCNVLRLIPTLLLYGHSSKAAADKFHDAAGWGMVPLAFVILMFVINLIEAMGFEVREDDGRSDGTEDGAAASRGGDGLGVARAERAQRQSRIMVTVFKQFGPIVVTLAMLAALAGFSRLSIATEGVEAFRGRGRKRRSRRCRRRWTIGWESGTRWTRRRASC